MKISKKFGWHCAHSLPFHKGLCNNVHGHSYKMEVIVESNEERHNGMVINFGDLKNDVNELIVNNIDHSYVFGNKLDEFETALENVLIAFGKKRFYLNKFKETTAENMADEFKEILECSLYKNYGLKVSSIKVWETDTAYAEE